MNVPHEALELAVAALGGLAVGTEREWSARERKREHDFAGVRTFLLLGLVGALSSELALLGFAPAGGALFVAGSLLALGAYVFAARRGDLEATTEVAAFVVLGAGALAGCGRIGLASGLFATTALVLMEKTRIHEAVFKLRSEEIEAGLRFAVLALVVLPLLPVGPYGPDPGLRPRELWGLVLIFSGLSFAGYVALRAAGPSRGYAVAGLLGGLVSSTAVTLDFARRSAKQPELAAGLAAGILAASTLVSVRVVAVALVLAPAVGRAVVPYLSPLFLAGVLLVLGLLRRTARDEAPTELPNPLALGAALRMALLFQAVLYLLAWSRNALGTTGVLGSAALVGLTDMDALTLAMAKLGADPGQTAIAARALGVGLLSNTLLKAALAAILGAAAVRRVATAGLLLLGAVLGATLLVLR
jgi:uncharacterized membrane protein (DUF4010 family)